MTIKHWFLCYFQTTAAAQLIENGPVEEQPQPERRVSTSSSEGGASYENVDISQLRSSSPKPEVQNSKEGQLADTIYSVPRPVGSYMKGDSGKATDSKVHKSTLTSESECSSPVDTVYSFLEKPKTWGYSTTMRKNERLTQQKQCLKVPKNILTKMSVTVKLLKKCFTLCISTVQCPIYTVDFYPLRM